MITSLASDMLGSRFLPEASSEPNNDVTPSTIIEIPSATALFVFFAMLNVLDSAGDTCTHGNVIVKIENIRATVIKTFNIKEPELFIVAILSSQFSGIDSPVSCFADMPFQRLEI